MGNLKIPEVRFLELNGDIHIHGGQAADVCIVEGRIGEGHSGDGHFGDGCINKVNSARCGTDAMHCVSESHQIPAPHHIGAPHIVAENFSVSAPHQKSAPQNITEYFRVPAPHRIFAPHRITENFSDPKFMVFLKFKIETQCIASVPPASFILPNWFIDVS